MCFSSHFFTEGAVNVQVTNPPHKIQVNILGILKPLNIRGNVGSI